MKINFPSIFTFLCCAFLFAACSHPKKPPKTAGFDNLTITRSMKGWELYSWPEGNTWKFSFLTGTNRLKTYSEVTSPVGTNNLLIVSGVDSAKMVLDKFPVAENITLIGRGWLQNTWREQYGNLQLPPPNAIDNLRSFSARKGLTFTVVN
ncbi:MAG: hypothetical protein ABIO55_11725 [Ginsengibacter sp.]